jgi:hypothetical protein
MVLAGRSSHDAFGGASGVSVLCRVIERTRHILRPVRFGRVQERLVRGVVV